MPICTINNENAKIRQVFRAINGDIHIIYYCYSYIQGNGKNKSQKKLTHPECKENNLIIYKNGEGYKENFKIQREERFPNLIECWCKPYVKSTNQDNFPHNKELHEELLHKNHIDCWCDENLIFLTPVEAQNHRLEKHPEEFED